MRSLGLFSALLLTFAYTSFNASSLSSGEGVLDLINTLRTADCNHALSSTQRLHANERLDAVAKRVMEGDDIDDALRTAEIHVTRSTVIQIRGSTDDESMRRILTKRYCDSITSADLTATGVALREKSIVIVLAKPVDLPKTSDATAIGRQVLKLVNEARAAPRQCGNRNFVAVPPLSLNAKLNDAATTQAHDMAANGRISHRGTDGSKPSDRVKRTGYAWLAVGENVAAGQTTAKEVVAEWLSSPAHCANIMSTDFTQMGIAYVTSPKQKVGIYWAQVFGRPR
jgi:uncharacterized protein YkwD